MQTLREELWEDFLKSVMQWYEMQRKHTFSRIFNLVHLGLYRRQAAKVHLRMKIA